MKSAVAVLMQTTARLAQTGCPPDKDIVLVLTADEEWGYRGAGSVAESGLIDDAELLVIAEPTSNSVYVGQKGELWIEATFTGREAHGSMPETGISAILPAARFCTRLQAEMAGWHAAPGRGRTTLNIGRFDGGRQVNIVPALTTVQLDIRVISRNHHEDAIRAVSDIGTAEASAAGCKFSYREMSYYPPILTEPQHPWAHKLLEAARATTGQPQPLGLSPYSTDAVSITPTLNIPVLICGPGGIEQAHQPNEFIEIEQIAQSLELFAAFVA
jgi:acetylornithine deacetylase/succinyl-diaminopimelate desuccinylase-like protein